MRLSHVGAWLALITGIRMVASRDWWVNPGGGSGSPGCGQGESMPCTSISAALDQAWDGDVIWIKASTNPTENHFYETCTSAIEIAKSVTLSGYGGRVRLGCRYHPDLYHTEDNVRIIFHILVGIRRATPTVKFRDLEILNGRVFFERAVLVIESCVMTDVAIRSRFLCDSASVHITDSRILRSDRWDGNPEVLSSSVICIRTRGKIRNSTLSDVNFNWVGISDATVEIQTSRFTQELSRETGMGGVNISVPYESGYILVADSIFEKHVHYDPILSSINIESSVLRIEGFVANDNRSASGSRPNSSAIIEIADCVFRDNERAISISRGFANISITRCEFARNAVMHAAAAMRLAIDDHNHVYIRDSVFRDNAAGFNRHQTIPGRFQFDGVQVWISGESINGIISLVGKGGAIRIHRGHVVFDNCTFVNNSARLLGGAVFLDRNGTAAFRSCYLENTQRHQHAMQGDLIYSGGKVDIDNCKFKVVTAHDHISMLRHSGDHWSMDVQKMWFECPTGHRLVMVNNTSHRIRGDMGLTRSHRLDQLYYYCETCGENQYSVDRGFLNYTVTSDQDEYFTLWLNGKMPFTSHPVSFEYGNITCRQCPYGGDCEGDIKAIANFWGYHWNARVAFQHCPPDYCCTSTDCPAMDTCAAYRHGRLCGRCQDGYSETLFSSSCVPNEMCRSSWIWAVLMMMGVVYTLFLIFQRDLREFISAGGVNWHGPGCCCGWQSPASFVLYVQRKAANGRPGNMTSDDVVAASRRSPNHPVASSTSTSDTPGTLIILFYYFQDALLLHIETIYTKTVSKFVKRLKTFLVGLFRFRLDFFQFLDDVCLFPNLQPVDKMFFKILFVPFVLGLFGATYLLCQGYKRLRRRMRRDRRGSRSPQVGCEPPDGVACPLNEFSRGVNKWAESSVPDPETGNGVEFRPCGGSPRDRNNSVGGSGRGGGGEGTGGTEDGDVEGGGSVTMAPPRDFYEEISCRLASGFVLAMLFTYQKLATATFALLNCVPVGGESVLFMDGTQTCFQPWQYAVMAYAFLSVVPFCSILMLGPPLLSRGEISLSQFFLGCLFPMPSLLWWIFRHVTSGKRVPHVITPEAQTVLKVLQGPFKEAQGKGLVGQLCWAGLLLGRRLLLFLCYTFINDVLVRLLCMMCACFVILMHHMYVRPYRTSGANLAGALSAAALLVVGAINLLRAGFEAAEYIPQGPYRFLMEVCEEIENTLVLWLPLMAICLIAMFLLLKLGLLLFDRGRRGGSKSCTRGRFYDSPVETHVSAT